jgi:hypothetical protein
METEGIVGTNFLCSSDFGSQYCDSGVYDVMTLTHSQLDPKSASNIVIFNGASIFSFDVLLWR